MWRTASTAELSQVHIVANGSAADVWIRTDIETVEDEDGTHYEANETHGLFSPPPTEAEVEANLSLWISLCEAQNKTEEEVMRELGEASVRNAALLEYVAVMADVELPE